MNEEEPTNAAHTRPAPPEARIQRATQGADGVWHLVIICPHCLYKHSHGGGNAAIPGGAGHRVSHCWLKVPGRDLGYTLVFDDLTDIVPYKTRRQPAKAARKQHGRQAE